MSTIIKVKCVDQVLTFAATPVVASGGLGEDFVSFEFCEKWDGLAKTAVFWRSEDDAYHVILDGEDTCPIPVEVLETEGVIHFGVFGVAEGKTRTSEVLTYNIVQGVVTEGTKPSDPTQDIYQQILADYAEVLGNLETFNAAVAASAADASAAAASAAAAEAQAGTAASEAAAAQTQAESAAASAAAAEAQAGAAASEAAAAEAAAAAAQTAAAGAVPTTRKVNGKALSGDVTLGYADVNAAPAGFGGFGETWVTISGEDEDAVNASLSSVLATLKDSSACQVSVYPKGTSFSGRSGYGRLYRAYSTYGGLDISIYGEAFLHKRLFNGVWSEWEWDNPPMTTGVEYRTTERIGGAAVYKKKVGGDIYYRLEGSAAWYPYADAVGALPTTGGTLTSASLAALTLNRDDELGAALAFSNSSGPLGYIGMAADEVLTYYTKDVLVNHQIFHTGNSASLGVWKSVDIAPLVFDDARQTAWDNRTAAADLYLTVDLPERVDMSKYLYEFKLEAFGLTRLGDVESFYISVFGFSDAGAASDKRLARVYVTASETDRNDGETAKAYYHGLGQGTTDENNGILYQHSGYVAGTWQGAYKPTFYDTAVDLTEFGKIQVRIPCGEGVVRTSGLRFSYRAVTAK